MRCQGKGFFCNAEATDNLVYLFWVCSCRSPPEAPFLPSKIIQKRSINQNNGSEVKAMSQSRVLEESYWISK